MNLVKLSPEYIFSKPKNFSVTFNEVCVRNLIERGTLMSSVSAVSQKRDVQRKKEKKDKRDFASNCDANMIQFLNIDFIS